MEHFRHSDVELAEDNDGKSQCLRVVMLEFTGGLNPRVEATCFSLDVLPDTILLDA